MIIPDDRLGLTLHHTFSVFCLSPKPNHLLSTDFFTSQAWMQTQLPNLSQRSSCAEASPRDGSGIGTGMLWSAIWWAPGFAFLPIFFLLLFPTRTSPSQLQQVLQTDIAPGSCPFPHLSQRALPPQWIKWRLMVPVPGNHEYDLLCQNKYWMRKDTLLS